MIFEDTLDIVDFSVNAMFMLITLGIMFRFLSRFQGRIPWGQTNVSGFVLITLGLSFHIMGVLTVQLIINTSLYSKVNHFLDAFIAFAVVLFIMGTAFIAFHNSEENQRIAFKIFAWVFAIVGMIDVFYNLYLYVADDNVSFGGFDPRKTELVYLAFEMLSLTLIYTVIFFNAKKSIRPLVVARYRILSFISLGFVLVILTDTLLKLGVIAVGSISIFIILFVLHVITVGGMYSLVFLPDRVKRIFGITAMPTA